MEITADALKEMEEKGLKIRKAIAEDAVIREQSRRRSHNYLEAVENEKDTMPEWMWNLLWFILGAFFWASIPAFVDIADTILKSYGMDIRVLLQGILP